jgi:hypothetical protein
LRYKGELTEFETTLLESSKETLKLSVVTLREEGGVKFLAAHVLFSCHFPEAARDKYFAHLRVPDLLQSSVIVAPDELPLTGHSKFDRTTVQALALDYSGGDSQDLTNSRIMTQGELELEELWRNVLPFAPTMTISPQSNSFHLVGSFLLLVKL